MLDSTDPIFSNDTIGALKLLGVLIAGAGSVIGAIWYFMSGKLAARVGAVESKQEADETRIAVLERDYMMLSANLRGIDAASGRIEKQYEHVIAEIRLLQITITDGNLKNATRIANIEGQLRGQRKTDGET